MELTYLCDSALIDIECDGEYCWWFAEDTGYWVNRIDESTGIVYNMYMARADLLDSP